MGQEDKHKHSSSSIRFELTHWQSICVTGSSYSSYSCSPIRPCMTGCLGAGHNLWPFVTLGRPLCSLLVGWSSSVCRTSSWFPPCKGHTDSLGWLFRLLTPKPPTEPPGWVKRWVNDKHRSFPYSINNYTNTGTHLFQRPFLVVN